MRSTAVKSDDSSGNIRVVCRFRPLNSRELSETTDTCVRIDSNTVAMTSGESSAQKFTFDAVFPSESAQEAVYDFAAKPTVESVLEGFNGTVFAYGQTGSGKTFTMTGPDVDDPQAQGIIPRMVGTVFQTIAASGSDMEFSVKVAYAEIYMERLKDLLQPGNTGLEIHEDKTRGVYIAGITEEYVSSEQDVFTLMKLGSSNRQVGATLMNQGSSRSHALFLLTISQSNKIDFSAKTGKLYLVDLAGSEKVGKTGAEGKRLDEAKNINKSLSTLGLVITSLTDGKSTHVPYRDSKLTRVLQDSLGGNSKTCLIITCSPSSFNEMETLSTLRFGARAKCIKNKPKINREVTVAELKLLLARAEADVIQRDGVIQTLKKLLVEAGGRMPTEQEILLHREEEVKEEYESVPSQVFEELKAEMDSLREENESLRRTNAQLSESLRLETELKEFAQAESEESKMKLASLAPRVTSLQGQIQDREDEITRLKAQMQRLVDEANEAKSQLVESEERTASEARRKMNEESIHMKISGMEYIFEAQVKEIQELRDKVGQFEAEAALRSKREESDAAVKKMLEAEREKNVRLSEEVTNLTERISTMESERELPISRRSAVQEQELISENTSLRKQLSSLQSHLFSDSTSIRSVRFSGKEQAKIHQESVDELKQELEKTRQDLQSTQHDLENRVEKVIQLEMELESMQETNNMLLGIMSGGDKALQKHAYWLETEIRRLTMQGNRRLNEFRRLTDELGGLQCENAKLKDRLMDAESNLAASLKTIEDLWQTREEAQRQREQQSVFNCMRSLNPTHLKKVIRGGSREVATMPSQESDTD